MSSNTKVFGRSSAFPASDIDRGIDKLEYFAGQALTGLLASGKYEFRTGEAVAEAYIIAVQMLDAWGKIDED